MNIAESMRQTVTSMLQGIDRYNPNNLPALERYVEAQSQENAYDLEANLCVLKLYQFSQNYNINIISQILMKALTNLPHTDFILCKALLNEKLIQQDPINQIVYIAGLLETCDFQQFWLRIQNTPDLHAKITGFHDSIRKFICHVVGSTYELIEMEYLSDILGGIDENTLRLWVRKYGWKELPTGNMIHVSKQNESVKTKNITENILVDMVASALNIY